MGFQLKRFIGNAAPAVGRAVGSYYGGPIGGAVGGAIGDEVKSGLTKPGPTGAEAGKQSRDYLNAAYPGTNPWEQLGTSAPGGAMSISERQQSTQRAVAKNQVGAQTSIAANQVRTAKEISDNVIQKDRDIADIHGRATAVNNAGHIGIGQVTAMGNYITGKETAQSSISGESTQRVSALAQRLDSWTRANALILKKTEVAAAIGRGAGNPATAALQALAYQAFQMGTNKNDLLAEMDRSYNKLRAAGVAVDVVAGLANVMRGFIGRLQLKRGKR